MRDLRLSILGSDSAKLKGNRRESPRRHGNHGKCANIALVVPAIFIQKKYLFVCLFVAVVLGGGAGGVCVCVCACGGVGG